MSAHSSSDPRSDQSFQQRSPDTGPRVTNVVQREPDTVALQLDLATEAALAAIPLTPVATRSAAGRALETSIERFLSDGGLVDVARRYRAYRQRRTVATANI